MAHDRIDSSDNLRDNDYQPCDKRFRTTRYFLEDQLRCSEAVADFKSIRNLMNSASGFTVRTAFRFQSEPVWVKGE